MYCTICKSRAHIDADCNVKHLKDGEDGIFQPNAAKGSRVRVANPGVPPEQIMANGLRADQQGGYSPSPNAVAPSTVPNEWQAAVDFFLASTGQLEGFPSVIEWYRDQTRPKTKDEQLQDAIKLLEAQGITISKKKKPGRKPKAVVEVE